MERSTAGGLAVPVRHAGGLGWAAVILLGLALAGCTASDPGGSAPTGRASPVSASQAAAGPASESPAGSQAAASAAAEPTASQDWAAGPGGSIPGWSLTYRYRLYSGAVEVDPNAVVTDEIAAAADGRFAKSSADDPFNFRYIPGGASFTCIQPDSCVTNSPSDAILFSNQFLKPRDYWGAAMTDVQAKSARTMGGVASNCVTGLFEGSAAQPMEICTAVDGAFMTFESTVGTGTGEIWELLSASRGVKASDFTGSPH